MIDPVVSQVLAMAFALLFASAASHKLRNPRDFQRSVRDYRLLPAVFSAPVATALMLAEGVAAAALLAPASRSAGALLGAALLGVYAVAIELNLARGRRHVDCGCTGPGLRQPLSEGLVARNASLIAGLLVLTLPVSDRSLGALDVFTITLAFTAATLLYASAGRLMAEWPELARLRRRT